MKNAIVLGAFVSLSTLIHSCKSDATQQPVSYPNYSQLKVGNYWIYQQFNIDSSGNSVATNVFDSCYVEKDTLINGLTYYKEVRPNTNSLAFVDYNFLRDSLDCIVTPGGNRYFSSQDFTTTFYEMVVTSGNPTDTIAKITYKMDDKDFSTTTPAGVFVTSNFKMTYTMYPNWVTGSNPRYMHTRYAENVGIVVETLPFYASNPNTVERRLVRYHVQ